MFEPDASEAIQRIANRAHLHDQLTSDLQGDIGELHQDGWLIACWPSSRGGQGWGSEPGGAVAAFTALRALGRANLSLARLFEGHMNACKLVTLYGSDAQVSASVASVQSGNLLGVWGADDAKVPLRLQHKGRNGSRTENLSGAKVFASGLGYVTQAIVTAEDNGGVQLLLIPTDDQRRADVSMWDMAGMRATRSGRFDFTGIELSHDAFIGAPNDYYREPFFEGGIWRYCAAHLGAAEALYSLTRDALIERKRASDPHQQRRIVEMAIALETTRLLLLRAACEVEEAGAPPEKIALSLLAREHTNDACRTVLALSEQALGMGAHISGTPVERIRRDLSLFLCQAAPDAKRARAAEILVAKCRLPEHL